MTFWQFADAHPIALCIIVGTVMFWSAVAIDSIAAAVASRKGE